MLLLQRGNSFEVGQASSVFIKSRGSGTSRMVFVERELSVKTGSKVDRWEKRREEGSQRDVMLKVYPNTTSYQAMM